jgi:hypothetical protein
LDNEGGGDGLDMTEGLEFVSCRVEWAVGIGDCLDIDFFGGGGGLEKSGNFVDVVDCDVDEDDEKRFGEDRKGGREVVVVLEDMRTDIDWEFFRRIEEPDESFVKFDCGSALS